MNKANSPHAYIPNDDVTIDVLQTLPFALKVVTLILNSPNINKKTYVYLNKI